MGPGHEELKKFIIPTWAPGCRRISPGDGYLEALVQPNVEPIMLGIEKIVPEGIQTVDGTVHKMDVLVCATGFRVAFKPAFKVINAFGKSIEEDWTNGPNLYMGVSAPRFPNYYTIVGPGATWSNGTLLPSIETTIEYSVKIMKKIQTEYIKAIEVQQEALDDIYVSAGRTPSSLSRHLLTLRRHTLTSSTKTRFGKKSTSPRISPCCVRFYMLIYRRAGVEVGSKTAR